MENEDLVLQYQENRNRGAIAQLWERLQKLASVIAHKYPWLEYEDSMQDAFIVLANAAAAFDPRRNVPFTNYYAKCLHWYFAGKEDQDVKVLSLDAQVPGADSGITYADMLPDPVDQIGAAEHDADNDAAGEVIRNMLQDLPEDQAAAVKAVYWQGMTQAEAAQALGTDPAGIQKSMKKAYAYFRRWDHAEVLYSFYDGSAAYSIGVRGTGLKAFERSWTSATERAALTGL